MDWEAIARAGVTVGAPVAAIVGLGSRKRRLRGEIRENLALVEEIEKSEPLREFSLVSGWLHGRIALDVAKLTGQELDTGKKPIPWGGVVFATVLGLVSAAWTYWLVRDGFVWYSVIPGTVAALMALSVMGQVTGREKAPHEQGPLPPGAVAAPTEWASERVATSLALAAVGGFDNRLQPGMQADVVLRFAKLLQLGAYEAALDLADDNWLLCRLQSWLWNNREHYGPGIPELERHLDEMAADLSAHATWSDFVTSEAHQFGRAWGDVDFDSYGVAGNRRRVAADLDVVILAPVGPAGGYFVMSATAVPDAMVFLVRYADERWRVSNHLGISPPSPGWPSTWWNPDDPVIATLPDPGGGQSGDAVVADSPPTTSESTDD